MYMRLSFILKLHFPTSKYLDIDFEQIFCGELFYLFISLLKVHFGEAIITSVLCSLE